MTPADGGAAGALPPVASGCKRAWVRCKPHSRVGYYDYVPYSMSNPIGVMSCGCDTKGQPSIPEAEALAALVQP